MYRVLVLLQVRGPRSQGRLRVMALAVNGSGTIFKKCDRSNHRPDSNKGCASSTCQHTCDNPERCPHAWTLRYWVNGKQVEKSFKDRQHPSTGRVDFGSGRKLARDWQLKVTVDKRSGDIAFADHSKSGKQNFGESVESFIARLPVSDASKYHYRSVYLKHVKPVFGDMTLSQVAGDRDGVMDLLAVKMKHLSNTPRQQARYVIVGTVDEAVKAGKLSRHRLDGIELADYGRYSHKGFVFPTYEQVKFVADGGINPESHRAVRGAGLCVWLMRGCGLRIEEALAVSKEDFIEDGTVLRVAWQEAGTAQASQGGRVPRRACTFLAVGDGSGHARWAAHSWEREAVPAVRHDLLPVHARCRSGRYPGRLHAAFATPCLRFRDARSWRADYRACSLPRASRHQRHSPGVRAPAALCCQEGCSCAGR